MNDAGFSVGDTRSVSWCLISAGPCEVLFADLYVGLRLRDTPYAMPTLLL